MTIRETYYIGFCRIIKDGAPCRVAPWYRDLSPMGRALMRAKNTNEYADNRPAGVTAQVMRDTAKWREEQLELLSGDRT